PQFEFDSDFDDDINGLAKPVGGREPPLLDGGYRAIVQSARQPVDQTHVAHAAIATHDNLEHHFTFDAAAARIFGVIGFHFSENLRRRNAAAGPVRAAAHAAAGTIADAGAIASAKARSRARPGTATAPRAAAVRLRGR